MSKELSKHHEFVFRLLPLRLFVDQFNKNDIGCQGVSIKNLKLNYDTLENFLNILEEFLDLPYLYS